MKRSYRGVLLLCGILMLNIVVTQYVVHQYYYQHYKTTILFAIVNVILFPLALFIYRKEKNAGERRVANDK